MRGRNLFVVVLVIGLLAMIVSSFLNLRHAPAGESVKKHLRFAVEIVNKSAQPIDQAEVFIAMPLNLGGKQRLVEVKSSKTLSMQASAVSEGVLPLTFYDFAPYSSRTANVDFSLVMGDRTPEALEGSRYLESSDLISIDSAVARRYATAFVEGNHTPESFSKWLSNNLKYLGYIAEARGSDYALSQMAGDCTEYSAALVAVLRANQIPARIIVGKVMNESSNLVRSSDYHNWVEYYDGRRWHALDPQYGIDAETSSYVAFDVLKESNAVRSQRFFSTSKHLSIKIL